MITCLNCKLEAKYVLSGPVANQVFCESHLPWFIRLKKDLGTKVLLVSDVFAAKTEVESKPEVEELPKKSSKKKEPKEPVEVAEPVAEPVEEVVVEEEK